MGQGWKGKEARKRGNIKFGLAFRQLGIKYFETNTL